MGRRQTDCMEERAIGLGLRGGSGLAEKGIPGGGDSGSKGPEAR